MSTGLVNANYPAQGSTKASLIFSGDLTAADEGSSFIATNPTPGTAIATTTSVVDDATGASTHAQQKPVMFIQNQWTPGPLSSPNIYLRYLKMFVVQVPTSATSWKYAMRLSPNSNKLTTAGTAITPIQVSSYYNFASRASISFGAITTTDSTTDIGQRLIGNGQVSGAVPVALDEWIFTFGAIPQAIDSSITSANIKRLSIPTASVIIAPGWSWTLEMWGTSNAAAPSWEFELGWIERPTGQ